MKIIFKVLKVPFTFARLLPSVYSTKKYKVLSIESPVYFRPFTPLRLLNKKTYSFKMKSVFQKNLILIDPFTIYPFTPLCSLKKD